MYELLNRRKCQNYLLFHLSTICSSQFVRFRISTHFSHELENVQSRTYKSRYADRSAFVVYLMQWALEWHQMVVETYGRDALGRTQCHELFNKFKSVDFDVMNDERGRHPKMLGEGELPALLEVEVGNVDQATIYGHRKAVRNTLKIGRGVKKELAKRQKESRKPLANICSIGINETEESLFCIKSLWQMKNGYKMRTPNENDHTLTPAKW